MSHPKMTPQSYGLVFVALIALTGLTVFLSSVELGVWHTPVGLAIASVKAGLVILFFMHVLHSSRLIWVVALSGLAWLAILLALTFNDYVSRSWPL